MIRTMTINKPSATDGTSMPRPARADCVRATHKSARPEVMRGPGRPYIYIVSLTQKKGGGAQGQAQLLSGRLIGRPGPQPAIRATPGGGASFHPSKFADS